MKKVSYNVSEKSQSELLLNDFPINYLKSPTLSKTASNQQSTQLTQNKSMSCSLNSQNEKETSN